MRKTDVVLQFVVDCPTNSFGEQVPDAPLYFANKANVSNRVGMRRGSPEWARVQAFERAVKAAAQKAVAISMPAWPTGRNQYAVSIEIWFGQKTVRVRPSPTRKSHVRRQTGEARARAHDVDAVKSVLDAMEGPVFSNDRLIGTLLVRKFPRAPGTEGDCMKITVTSVA